MATSKNRSFRPSLEALEDRAQPGNLLSFRVLPQFLLAHLPALAPSAGHLRALLPPAPVAAPMTPNHLPPAIFNPVHPGPGFPILFFTELGNAQPPAQANHGPTVIF